MRGVLLLAARHPVLPAHPTAPPEQFEVSVLRNFRIDEFWSFNGSSFGRREIEIVEEFKKVRSQWIWPYCMSCNDFPLQVEVRKV
jgi:hypothetical protein